ncbi:MAG: bifunctional diaminohydroxyphosphoribosylaminopyrimidine deaminase/5-amino-6-(5-phosphoribosylamino)uracil reductase RibD [Actinomycetota bacterium]|nr:bifunctional diaminohydroxyphosphoribosylaminopyrimidine deaminase/5-amino-6-(5-phosphoribosylamino)uracil reductase RibD [Actinomycetota bacterium]
MGAATRVPGGQAAGAVGAGGQGGGGQGAGTSSPGAGGGAGERAGDGAYLDLALRLAASVRRRTSPNPWVGAVVVAEDGRGRSVVGSGATEPPGGRHAEIVALQAAGEAAAGATLYVTLEPCAHTGRTGPCADAVVAAGITRVVVGVVDPDPSVAGRGLARLGAAGVEVTVGVRAVEVAEQLAPYLHQRRTGRPFVVLKLATTLDGRIAAPDGSARWITGPAARADGHRLRADADAVLVGAGTVRADDPALTVRTAGDANVGGPAGPLAQPLRVVLGRAPAGARVQPALELSGEPATVLDELGRRGVLQLLVEGGARVAHDLHAAGLVDRYVLYLAPALAGGDDARPAFAGAGAPDVASLWRGRMVEVTRLGDDLKVVLEPTATPGSIGAFEAEEG